MFSAFGVSGAVLVHPGRGWHAFWCVCAVSWRRLGGVLKASWGHLGTSWADLGRVLARLRDCLGAFSHYFSRFFCHLERYAKIAKNLEKSMVFH